MIVRTVIPGRGPVIGPGDYVLFNVEGKVWAGDREVVDSYTDRQPQGLPLRSPSALPGLAAPGRAAGRQPGADGGAAPGRLRPPRATRRPTSWAPTRWSSCSTCWAQWGRRRMPAGTVVPYHPGPGLPRVGWGPRGPVITPPAAARPPAALVRRVLVRGHGLPVRTGQTVVVQYTGVVWRTGKIFDSSWARGFPESFLLGAGQVIPGWERGLARAAGGQPGAARPAARPRLRAGRGPARCGRARHPGLRDRHPRRAVTARPAGPG